ncbi:MAG: ribonuclease HIII [Kiritimatiellia bacterium]
MEPARSTYTYELDAAQQENLLGLLSACSFQPRKVPYSIVSVAGDGFNCTLYQKERHGKRTCVIQGGKARDFIEFYFELQVLGAATIGYEDVVDPARDAAHGGSDESGKGDYFGPLVVACCYVDPELARAMRELSVKTMGRDGSVRTHANVVRDCKQLSDAVVLAAGAELRRMLGPGRYSVVKVGPTAYNRLYARIRNVNRLLAWAHGTCIEELLEKQPACPRVVVDQFAAAETVVRRALKARGRKVVVDQHHRAESDSLAVAAASVIARELFLRDIAKMAEEIWPAAADRGRVPIGSSDPRVRALAEEMVRAHGPVWLMNHCKAHFQTTDKVLAACGKSRSDLPPEGRVVSAVKNGEYGHG